MKLCKCDICGKVVAMVSDMPVETVCCGQAMRELVPNTEDGAKEKHVPVCKTENGMVTVTVGSTAHPMDKDHYIEWIAIETEHGNQCHELKPGDRPQAQFALVPYDKVRNVYEYCSVHGLWKSACAAR